MKLAALLTSAGINTAVCIVLFSLYSILRKQPSLVNVYFGAKIAQVRSRQQDAFRFDRFVPSPSWILKAWETSDDEIYASGGLDAVVFVRLIVFSVKLFTYCQNSGHGLLAYCVCPVIIPLKGWMTELHWFNFLMNTWQYGFGLLGCTEALRRRDDPVHTYSVGVGEGGDHSGPDLRALTPASLEGRFEPPTLAHHAIVCNFLVLPLNYFGKEMQRHQVPAETLEAFTIVNVEEGSRWLWAHCFALYLVSCCACFLLYLEYRSITRMRLAYFTSSVSNPSYFTVLVRAIPWSREESYSGTVTRFFSNFYASSFLSHQIVYRSGSVQKLVTDAGKMCKILKLTPRELHIGSHSMRCGLCGTTSSFNVLPMDEEGDKGRSDFGGADLRKKCKFGGCDTGVASVLENLSNIASQFSCCLECAAALVFFRNRYAALVASQSLQSRNPMTWVTNLSPEPGDMYWSNICVPYRLLWIRKIAILVASMALVAFFVAPVSLTQGLVHLDKLQRTFPFLKGVLKRKGMSQLATGYLPSVVLIIFMYMVPPIMLLFSTLEGSISRSGRKRSASIKVLCFLIWNVFFGNILSGSVIERFSKIFKDVTYLLATAVPSTATFFMTYVLTSGWASLSIELMQPFGLLRNLFYRFILRNNDVTTYGTYTFPYHTEVPRILLFGLFGFVYSTLCPLILPFLLVYFSLAYLVYRNQILNVYVTKYETGGTYWPIVHNTTIFSMVLMQVIAMAVFGLKKSTVASSFVIPLIILTLLFNEYCRQRFQPLFKHIPAQILIEMDRQDEQDGKMKDIHEKLKLAYTQFKCKSRTLGDPMPPDHNNCRLEDLELKPGNYGFTSLNTVSLYIFQQDAKVRREAKELKRRLLYLTLASIEHYGVNLGFPHHNP
ncbi:CSC1-like protein RXW8 [Capsicum annuum]|nr:CSC1-like protein RXW8 [Capsicum annuum]